MFSIVIPTFNSAQTIAATLASVRRQTFRDYEVLITDDGSSDRTLEICQQYAREHSEVRISTASISHSGVAAARNDAVARASGDYVSFLDSDDRWMPEKLARVAALIKRDPQVDLIYHDVVYICKNAQAERYSSGPPPSDPYRCLLLENNFLRTSAVTLRRSCFARAGGFSCNPDFEICEDYELWLRVAHTGGKFAYIPEVLAQLVKTDGSLSSNITRHMRNRLHVRRHCLGQAFDAGVLSASEFKRHSYRVTVRCQAAIAGNEARQRHPLACLRAAATAAGACFQIALGEGWEMTRQWVSGRRDA
jgi:glycosyltransferase involved in cell wall biosynthesis